MADQWFIVRDDKKHGPYTLVQMKQLAASGKLLPIDMVLEEGQGQWVPASQVEAIFPRTGIKPAPPLPAPVAAEPAEWHFTQSGQQAGPVTWTRLRELAASGTLRPTDQVWKSGMPNWVPAHSVTGLLPDHSVTPPTQSSPPLPPGVPASSNGPSTSSRGELLGYKQEVWDEVWERCRKHRTLLICLGSASVVILVVGILLIASLRSDDSGGKALLGLMCPGCVLMPLAIGVWIVSEPIRKQGEAKKAAAAKEAEEASRWENLHGRWEPIDGQGAALQFTEDGALIRQDGLIAKYRIRPGDLIELYADDSPTTIQFKVMSLSEHELALTADGQGKHYIRGKTHTEEVHRQQWEAYKGALKGVGRTAANVAGGAALAVGALAFLGLAAAVGVGAAAGAAGGSGGGGGGGGGAGSPSPSSGGGRGPSGGSHSDAGPASQGRVRQAAALVGARIISQDGSTVVFKKVCERCGNVEPGTTSMAIGSGITSAAFQCSKCRNMQPYQIQFG
jgi:hypothetical protein